MQLPAREQLPLQDHRVVFVSPVQLHHPEKCSAIQSHAGEGATRGGHCGLKGSNAVSTANVVGLFDQGE